MKNPRTSEEIVSITNKYALAEEMTLDTREQKKESGHMDQPSLSKGDDMKRKADRSINVVERPRRHKEYRPKSGEFEGFLDHISFFHLQESTRPETLTDYKVLQMRFSRWKKVPIKRKSMRIPR
jgi:hypothetical protein